MRQDIWDTDTEPPRAPLRGRRTADAVVIGGGLSGMTVALWLLKAGLRVTLLEAKRVGFGASRLCAGIASLTNGLAYQRLEKHGGFAALDAYAQTQQAAFTALRSLCGEFPCDWRDVDAQLVGGAKDAPLLEAEADAMRRVGLAAQAGPATHCPFPAQSALRLKDMGALNAPMYLRGLAHSAEKLGLRLYEDSRVTAVETNLAYTDRGSVLAPYLVVATGYPIVNTPGWYFLKLSQRACGLALVAGGAAFDGVCLAADGSYAARGLAEGMLLQMNGARVGERRAPEARALYHSRYAPYLGGAAPARFHAGAEVYTPDGLPCAGAYSRKTPNLFVACGYGGRGLVGSVVAAQSISAAILGLPTEAYAVYSGSRALGGRAALCTLGRYLQSQTALRAPRCPHMGCKLAYNRRARIWECPCHGSRFDDIGRVLAAPAVTDAEINRR